MRVVLGMVFGEVQFGELMKVRDGRSGLGRMKRIRWV